MVSRWKFCLILDCRNRFLVKEWKSLTIGIANWICIADLLTFSLSREIDFVSHYVIYEAPPPQNQCLKFIRCDFFFIFFISISRKACEKVNLPPKRKPAERKKRKISSFDSISMALNCLRSRASQFSRPIEMFFNAHPREFCYHVISGYKIWSSCLCLFRNLDLLSTYSVV